MLLVILVINLITLFAVLGLLGMVSDLPSKPKKTGKSFLDDDWPTEGDYLLGDEPKPSRKKKDGLNKPTTLRKRGGQARSKND